MKSFLLALQFLTIVPVKVRGDVSEKDMVRSLSGFVFVGLVQGFVLLAAALLLERLFPMDLVTALVLLVYVLSSGGFHLDAIADTFDALACKGSREQRLEIMRDGSSGAIGITAIVFMLTLKYLAMRSVLAPGEFLGLYALFVMPVVSKWTNLFLMYKSVPAREEGLGAMLVNGLKGGGLAWSTIWMLLIMVVPLFALGHGGQRYFTLVITSLVAVVAVSIFQKAFFTRMFGGLTGDTLGAAGEASEVAFLLTASAWNALYF
jgi:adenosylcobinamide-GDP ribazoletransferase